MNEPVKHTASSRLFDLRILLMAVLGIYAIVLIGLGWFGGSEQFVKTEGININLWTGVVMLIVAIGFGVWRGIDKG